jgi:type VI secretion system secreted protein VgrG
MFEYSQDDRLLSITTSSTSELALERFSGVEALSRPFEFKTVLLSPDPSVDLKSLLRTTATVTLYLADGTARYFNAVFRSLKQAEEGSEVASKRTFSGISNMESDLTVYEGVLVPQIWFLSLDSNCRIFQDMTVPSIIEQLLTEAGIRDFQFNSPLRDTAIYPARDYCVQYRESTFNFIARLLEEEGIFFFFQHTDSKHTIIFADNSSILAPCPNQAIAKYTATSSGFAADDDEGIINLERLEQAHTGKSYLTDYCFETPLLNLDASLSVDHEEAFDYPGNYSDIGLGQRYAKVRLEAREVDQFVVNGLSHCRPFRPGYIFKLKEHYRPDTNQDYVLVSVSHDVYDSTYRQDEDKAHHYKNHFSCIPKTVLFRPAITARRPFVQGPQPALVVGKSGEEIWVDKYGRVKVQFYWDRAGKKNENSSCWVRVSQIWAGKNWGWMTIPRMGQEVIVDFLEGNPDRPIITGRVYNADQMPPYTLPDNQTQAGVKTRSTKAGTAENYNEIYFNDLKDNELLNIHAEKDMTTTVEHDDTQTIQNNRIISVTGTHTETIVKDTTITITEGNHSLTLNKGNQSITLDTGNQSISLAMGNQTTTVDLGSVSTEAMQSIKLTVGASSITISQTGITIAAPMININGEMTTSVEAGVMMTIKGAITMIN